jgi:hypothetical protein
MQFIRLCVYHMDETMPQLHTRQPGAILFWALIPLGGKGSFLRFALSTLEL